MNMSVAIASQIAPLYLLVGMGFLAGRLARIDRQEIATLLVYIVLPVVFFSIMLKARISLNLLAMPVLFFCTSTCFCIAVLRLSKFIWKDNTPNILALSAGTANAGYLGLPIAMLVFDDETLGLYFGGILGMAMFESSIGFYVTARGRHTAAEALKRLAKLPPIYGAVLGGVAASLSWQPPEEISQFFTYVRGAYVMLGMMVIGFGISTISKGKLDWLYVVTALAMKFIAIPLAIIGLVGIDQLYLHLFSAKMHSAMLLLSFMPLAANTVVFATLLNVHPEKVAVAVIISTFLAILTIPFMVGLFL